MPFPLIPILAIAGIVGGITALAWYTNLSSQEQAKADRLAMQWFGRRFKELAKHQQNEIRDQLG